MAVAHADKVARGEAGKAFKARFFSLLKRRDRASLEISVPQPGKLFCAGVSEFELKGEALPERGAEPLRVSCRADEQAFEVFKAVSEQPGRRALAALKRGAAILKQAAGVFDHQQIVIGAYG